MLSSETLSSNSFSEVAREQGRSFTEWPTETCTLGIGTPPEPQFREPVDNFSLMV